MKNWLSGIWVLSCLCCTRTSAPPLAILEVFPPAGDSTTFFELDAGKSGDDRNYQIALRYRWDYNGDGAWDTDFSSNPLEVHSFPIPGTYKISVEVRDHEGLTSIARDSIIVIGRNRNISTFVDPRDGQTYRIVKLNERWWMGENLRYGEIIDHWTQDQADNQSVERYMVKSDCRNAMFSVYSWHEAMNHNLNSTRGICPEGWHLPTKKEWESLYQAFPRAYALNYLGENGLSGLDLNSGAAFMINRILGSIIEFQCNTSFWSADYKVTPDQKLFASEQGFGEGRFLFSYIDQSQLMFSSRTQALSGIRCIKDPEQP